MPKLNDLLSVSQLTTEIANGYVTERRHPHLPLRIFNYTLKAAFEKHWNDVTVKTRGLVADDDDFIVARCFEKFFNHGERDDFELPTESPEILEKMDGSLGILVDYCGERLVATRGSFTSPQALWATEWLRREEAAGNVRISLPSNHTALFEIISPVSRIVVPYDFEGLVLLSIVENNTGVEPSYANLAAYAERWGVSVCRRYEKIDETIPDFEGYVLTWRRLTKPPTRVKIKLSEYLRLHRLLTTANPKRLWQSILGGHDLSPLFERTPEDFQRWVRGWVVRIWDGYERDALELEKVAQYVERFATAKDRALWLQANASDYHGMYFARSSEKRRKRVEGDVERSILDYKLLRRHEPRGDEPFVREVE